MHRHRTLARSLAAAGFGIFVAAASAQTTSHLAGGDYTFTASSSLASTAVTTTVETGTGPTITAPAFVYPEAVVTSPGAAVDTSDGFSLTGRYDFLNGSGTSAQLIIQGRRAVTLTSGDGATASDLLGLYGIDSADFTNPVTGNAGNTPVAGTLSSFTVQTYLMPGGGGVLGSATAAGNGGTIPVTAGFPAGALVSTGPETNGAYTGIAPGDYTLVQTVTINFSGLIPGESVDILLAPEPGSTTLMLAAAAAGLGFVVRRRHRVPDLAAAITSAMNRQSYTVS